MVHGHGLQICKWMVDVDHIRANLALPPEVKHQKTKTQLLHVSIYMLIIWFTVLSFLAHVMGDQPEVIATDSDQDEARKNEGRFRLSD